MTWTTDDGVEITDGMLVMNNDLKYGYVDFATTWGMDETYSPFDGWFSVKRADDTGGGGSFNGERLLSSARAKVLYPDIPVPSRPAMALSVILGGRV